MASRKYFWLITIAVTAVIIAAIAIAAIRVILFYAHNFLVYALHCL